MSDLPALIMLTLRILLVFFLYIFLGWSLWTLWKDLRLVSPKSQQAVIPISIAIKQGEELIEAHLLSDPYYIIGRSASCDISLSDETVSGQHAKIYFESANWWVEDLGSSNGTLINDTPLRKPTVLTDRDILHFGNMVATIDFILTERILNS